MTIYLVALRGESGIRLDAVSAGNAVQAAEMVNRKKNDVGGTMYSVEPEDRSEQTIEITVD
jgi:hypothetical protein